MPLASFDWSSPNFNRIPRALILGENNVAFGSDGQSAVAFDVTSGTQKWTFQPGDVLTGVALLNSRADGGATGYTADRNSGIADALLTFDPSGTAASFPLASSVNGSPTSNIDNLSFFDPATLLATTTTGQAQLAASIDLQPSEGIWFTEAGDHDQRENSISIKISDPQSIKDGEAASFRVTVLGADQNKPPTYQWSFKAPGDAGNNPNVNFTDPAGSSTNTDGHWFAEPNQACPPNAGPTGPYWDAQYKIQNTVTIPNRKAKTVKTTSTVNAYWNPAGQVNPNDNDITGLPTMASDNKSLWHVTGKGNLARKVPTQATIFVIPQSQFYNKTAQHEQVHVTQWIAGPGHLFGDLWNPDNFYNQIQNLTATSQAGLTIQINEAKVSFFNAQAAIYQQRVSQAEKEAFAVSDQIAPQYAYQNCSRY